MKIAEVGIATMRIAGGWDLANWTEAGRATRLGSAAGLVCGLMLGGGSAVAQATPPPAPAAKASAAAAEPWKKIPIPALHAFKPVEPKRIDLANGLVIFLQEDHELPFIHGSILIRGGSRDEPAAKIGLVSLSGQTWRTSGTATLSGDALDTQLAAKAARIETGGSIATTSMSWSSLKGDFDSTFASAIDLLEHPDFKADKLALGKRQMEARIARRNDDAEAIAGREVSLLVYGDTSPYARQTQYATVEAVTLDDLNAWHKRTAVPDNMIVAVSGDFDSAAMEKKLRGVFEPMQRGERIHTPTVEFPGPKPGVYFVDKEDVNQSNIYIVGLGTQRDNPDFYALSIMNEVFSGGFGSRVFQYVRTKLGLAYSVGGSFTAQYDHPGIFYTGAGTKSVSTVPAAQAMLEEIARLKTKPPTPEEMRSAKDQELNSFIFNYDIPEKTLGEQVTLAFYGYPADFLQKYKDGIERVTSADVTRVANKYIDVSKLAIIVVGNKSEIQPAVSTLGAVKDLDIAIPPPPARAKQ
jgi:zinc protease